MRLCVSVSLLCVCVLRMPCHVNQPQVIDEFAVEITPFKQKFLQHHILEKKASSKSVLIVLQVFRVVPLIFLRRTTVTCMQTLPSFMRMKLDIVWCTRKIAWETQLLFPQISLFTWFDWWVLQRK